MGEMGERERLEQEHADKMRLKNRDESAVKVQFQIDAYKKVFAEQRLAASRQAERVRQAKLREAQAQKVVDDARKQELRQIVSKQLEAVKLQRSTRARQSEDDLKAATGFAPRHPDSVDHIGAASRKLVSQMDPLFGCAAPLPARVSTRSYSPNHTTPLNGIPFTGTSVGLASAGLSLMQCRILPYPCRVAVLTAGRPSQASSLSMQAYLPSRVLHARRAREQRRSPPCHARASPRRTGHRPRPSFPPRRRQQLGACKARQGAGLLRWAWMRSASRKHRSSLARAPPRSAPSQAPSLRRLPSSAPRSSPLGRPPRLACWRRLMTPRPARPRESGAERTSYVPGRAMRHGAPPPSRARPRWRRASARARRRAWATPRAGPRLSTRRRHASPRSRPRARRRSAARHTLARRPTGAPRPRR